MILISYATWKPNPNSRRTAVEMLLLSEYTWHSRCAWEQMLVTCIGSSLGQVWGSGGSAWHSRMGLQAFLPLFFRLLSADESTSGMRGGHVNNK
eukprot:5462023-Amphidinium_carterae.1